MRFKVERWPANVYSISLFFSILPCLITNLCNIAVLLLSGSIIYRSARGAKPFGYRQLDADLTAPMQRSVTSVHPKRHERRLDGIGFRMHGRSGVSSHKVAPLAPVSKQEELLINFDDDCSAVPQTASTVTASQHQQPQSNADVLSLLDSSVADKYQCLPPALGEKRRVPYDPFEISEDLKNYASQNATPLHSSSVTPSQQYDAASLHHSWSSFDSFSSQDVNDSNELGSPTPAVNQNRVTTDSMFASTVSDQAFVAGTADTNAKTVSETDLLTYANIPSWPEEGNKRQVSTYSNRHSYSNSNSNRPSSRRRRRRDQTDHSTSAEVTSDLNANSLVPRPVSACDSADWIADGVSQLSVGNTAVSQSAAVVSTGWDGKSLSRRMKAAKKKMPVTGSVFYDDVDDDCGNATAMNSCQDRNDDNTAPPVPPRDYAREYTASMTESTDAIYANVSERNQSIVSSDISGTRQLAEVRPFVQASSDVYQNYSEFSQSRVDSADQTVYANVKEQLSAHPGGRSSFIEATACGDVGQFGGASHSAIYRVRRRVPAASQDECQAALVCCYGDVESAIRHLKVEQLTRLGIAPRERCQMLLEACNWNLESAGSVLLHELSTGSPV